MCTYANGIAVRRKARFDEKWVDLLKLYPQNHRKMQASCCHSQPFGSVDATPHSATRYSDNTLAHQPNTPVSDFVTVPQNEAVFSAPEIAKLADALPRIPSHLRAAILLMVLRFRRPCNLSQRVPDACKTPDFVRGFVLTWLRHAPRFDLPRAGWLAKHPSVP